MIGSTISHYKIVSELGRGGMGIVYKAEDTKLDRTVALKFLPTSYTVDADVKRRFEREARTAAALNHPNIITVYEIDEHEGRTFIAMEYVEGESLRQKVNEGQFPVESAVDIATQTCEGLSTAHQAGIIHRDIKPENIIIDKSGRVRILDFGLARIDGASKLTKEASALGTISYMSPEQFRGEPIDARADVWAVGVVLYEMLTGKQPFEGDYEQAVMYSVCNVDPPSMSNSRPDLPASAETTICRALEKDQSRRHSNMQELLQDLKAMTAAPTVAPRREKSIVVLPFQNMSSDPEQEYFSDGLTEEIISDLSQVHDLLVISRSSAMTFKGTKKKIREIAQDVNVRYVLEGSVRKAGNNLRITAQLIDAATDVHLWAEKYGGTRDDVFEIQEKVSRSIVDALAVRLSTKEDKVLSERPINDAQAYDYYLRARQDLNALSEEGIDRALNHLQKGLDIVGENALLYAGMGLVYVNYYEYGIRVDEETLRTAEHYAFEVMRLEPGSCEAYLLQGRIERFRGRLLTSIKSFRSALEINPREYEAVMALAWMYSVEAGRAPASEPLIRTLFEIDPLARFNHFVCGIHHLMKGELDLALSSLKQMRVSDPDNILADFWSVHVLAWKEQYEDAYALIDQMTQKETQDQMYMAFAGWLPFFKYALKGEKEKALSLMNEDSRQFFWNDPELSWLGASTFALIDEKEEALNWLEHTINKGWINYPLFAELDPLLENIRGEKRFKELMNRIKPVWENFEV